MQVLGQLLRETYLSKETAEEPPPKIFLVLLKVYPIIYCSLCSILILQKRSLLDNHISYWDETLNTRKIAFTAPGLFSASFLIAVGGFQGVAVTNWRIDNLFFQFRRNIFGKLLEFNWGFYCVGMLL